MRPFAEALQAGALRSLTRLELDWNQIDDHGALAISRALAASQDRLQRTQLLLGGNKLTDAARQACMDASAGIAHIEVRF